MKNEDEKRKKSSNPKMKRRKTNDSQGDQEDSSVSLSASASVSPTDNNLSTGACENVSQRYEKVGRVGQGTYGVVYKARDKIKGDFVALKRCIPHHESSDGFPLTTLREIHALRVCSQHPHIVSLLQVSVSSSNGVFLVFEYCTHDLAQLIDAYYPKHRKSPFQQSHVKTLLRQLLSALEFVHLHYLLHRDVKLSNLLYTSDGQLKLADFGLSRHSGRQLTPNVVSLWYRAPELMLMKDNGGYTPGIDLWAVGCVFGELLQGCK
jgi:serine/threonine protein kinase